MVRRLAGGLVAKRPPEGQRVLIRAANDIDFVLAFFAATAIGCVAQPHPGDADDRGGEGAMAAQFGRDGDLSGRGRAWGEHAIRPSSGFQSAGDPAARRRSGYRRLRPTRRPTIRPLSSSPRARPPRPRAGCTRIGW